MKIFLNSFYLKKDEKLKGLIKLSGKTEKIIEELKAATNDKGYVNLFIAERKEPTKNQTHYIYDFKKD